MAIFAIAFLVRMAFVAQVKDSPYWRVPLMDAREYHMAAQDLLANSWLGPLPDEQFPVRPYYHPPLYQLFLALIYLVFGHSVTAAIIIQHLIGALTCVLVYFIGSRFFGRSVGTAAGVALASTGSQIFYESRLLPQALITFLNMAIILLAARQMKSPVAWHWPLIGLLIGLSAITRPDILLFLPAMLAWMWIERKALLPSRPVIWTAVLLFGAMLPVGLTSARNYFVGKDFQLISCNGGVNFFIGNHPNLSETLAIRPGVRWEMISYQSASTLGAAKLSTWSRYYYRQAFKLMWQYKRMTVANLVRKFIWVWRGPEIQRDEDEYYFGQVSRLYHLLLWRVGNFGFPFGVIAPLGLLGMIVSLRRRRELFLPYAFVITQVFMLVFFFPCSRYRAPILPVMLIFGAAAVLELANVANRKQVGEMVSLVLMLAALGAASIVFRPSFEGTPDQIKAENHRMFGTALYVEGRLDEGIIEIKKGLELTPNDPDLHKWLMDVYVEKGDYARAEKEAVKFISIIPQYAPAYQTLIEIYEAEGKYKDAEEVRRAVEKAVRAEQQNLGAR